MSINLFKTVCLGNYKTDHCTVLRSTVLMYFTNNITAKLFQLPGCLSKIDKQVRFVVCGVHGMLFFIFYHKYRYAVVAQPTSHIRLPHILITLLTNVNSINQSNDPIDDPFDIVACRCDCHFVLFMKACRLYYFMFVRPVIYVPY